MNESTGKSLIKTIVRSELRQVATDLAEIGIDSILNDGFLKDVPVIATIKSVINVPVTIKEELFIRKLMKFLVELQSIPLSERQKILKRYPNGSKEQHNLGENILLAIDRLDDMSKPELLAKFFCAYIKDEIDFIMFSRLARALERLNLSLLPHLKWFYLRVGEQIAISEEIYHELSLAGIVTANLSDSGTIGGGAYYSCSELGFEFLRIGYDLKKE